MKHVLRAAAVAFSTVGLLLPVASAEARPTRDCKSADLRYPFTEGGPKTFGVFKLQITGGSCPTAHKVAKAWMKAFEANISNGSTRRPKTAAGFTVTELPPNEAQTYRLRARKGSTSIRFNYVVPNG